MVCQFSLINMWALINFIYTIFTPSLKLTTVGASGQTVTRPFEPTGACGFASQAARMQREAQEEKAAALQAAKLRAMQAARPEQSQEAR